MKVDFLILARQKSSKIFLGANGSAGNGKSDAESTLKIEASEFVDLKSVTLLSGTGRPVIFQKLRGG
jgi:hypothetical protein